MNMDASSRMSGDDDSEDGGKDRKRKRRKEGRLDKTAIRQNIHRDKRREKQSGRPAG